MAGTLNVKRTPSTESTGSIQLSNADSRTATQVNSQTDAQYELYDCASVLIECPAHKVFALQRINGKKGLWLPKTVVTTQSGFWLAINAGLKQVLAAPGIKTPKGHVNYSPPEVFHYLRLQVPVVNKYISRVIFKCQVVATNGACCKTNPNVKWATQQELESCNGLWGPEPGIFVRALKSNQVPQPLQELTLKHAMRFLPRANSNEALDRFLLAAKYTEKDVERLYDEFIQHCYPAQLMTRESLAGYMMSIKWVSSPGQADHFFRAFSQFQRNYLNFHEFLEGMVAADKLTDHSKLPGHIRAEFIFRMYDSDGDMVLSPQEVRKLVTDATAQHGKSHDSHAVEKHVQSVSHALGVDDNCRWDITLFKEALGGLHLRGTSKLCRGSSTLSMAKGATPANYGYRIIDGTFENVTCLSTGRNRGGDQAKCPECKAKNYMIAGHSVRLRMDGVITDPQVVMVADNAKMPADVKAHSDELFPIKTDKNKNPPQCPANIAIAWCKSQQVSNNLPHLASVFLNVANKAANLMRGESKLARLNAPVFIIGALLGHCHALRVLDHVFWPKGPAIEAASFLFLGNYLSSGLNSLETILHLLALKCQCPQRVILLRGGTESKESVAKLTQELSAKLSPAIANQIQAALLAVFEAMPLSALIDHSIFCTSSGIPTSARTLEELNHAPNVQILEELAKGEPKKQEGQYAGFMARIGVSHIVTGSELSPNGIMYRLNGKALSIFSCPGFGGQVKFCGILMIDAGRIRPIKVTI